MTRSIKTALVGLVLAFLALAPCGPAWAVLELDITEGVVEPLPIAISPFYGDSAEASARGAQIANLVEADLARSGLFRPLDRRAFIQSPAELQSLPRFADWRQINAQALVTGQVTGGAEAGPMVVEFRLFDVFAGSQLTGLRFETEGARWRRVAHKIADAVYARITGEPGYFDTRIVYVAESGPATDRVKRLAIMDQDGANHEFLTDGGDLVLTPRFNPAGNEIAYMAFRGPHPQVVLRNLASGRESPVGSFDAMTSAPRFAPDGRTMVLTVSQDGNSDLFLVDPATGAARRLTNHPAIDTSAAFSPDGDEIVFNSDRAGTPQLYVMSLDGTGLRRISFGGGNYGSPVWSPRGDLIAFTKIEGGYFHIGVMRPDGSDERLLTRSTRDESPTFAPNGRVIMFTRSDVRTGQTRLYSIDVTGSNERPVPTPIDGSDPDWSGLLP